MEKKYIKQIAFYSIMGIISGLVSFLFIALVNKVIDLSIKDQMPAENNFILLFSMVIILFFISRRLLSEGVIRFSQRIFWNIREHIIKDILKAPYLKVHNFKDEIYSVLATDVNNITNASLIIIGFISSIILVIASFAYLCYLSPILFLISLLFIISGILMYVGNTKSSNTHFKIVRDLEQDFIGAFNSILEGNKEIKINPQKGQGLFDAKLSSILAEGEKRNVDAYVGYLNNQLISQVLFYLIIAGILMLFAAYFDISLGISVSFVFALLYLIGPISNIMLNIPVLNRALISYNRVKKLKTSLHLNTESTPITTPVFNENEQFEAITYSNYEYSYPDGAFSLGPINLSVKSNEIIFIYGGNGAGKTTFVNTLLTLYTPKSGEIKINDRVLNTDQFSGVKELFSPVFNDFYLFDSFYGIPHIDTQKVEDLLVLFELDHKVRFENYQFSSTDLSTGQRKRLALIMAILEERPILVLDEWAADQDPAFRKKFYTEIIHTLVREENKTIIAITHDDQYYNQADRLFQMDYGKLTEKKEKTFIKSEIIEQ